MTVTGPTGTGSSIEIVEYEESLAPEVVACIFWLKNRRRDEWRDKQDHEHAGTVDHKVTVNGDEAILSLIEDIARAAGPLGTDGGAS